MMFETVSTANTGSTGSTVVGITDNNVVMPQANNMNKSNNNNDNTEREFEDILNQLSALGDTIDQELSNGPKSLNHSNSTNSSSQLSQLPTMNNQSMASVSTQSTATPSTTTVNNNYHHQNYSPYHHPSSATSSPYHPSHHHNHHQAVLAAGPPPPSIDGNVGQYYSHTTPPVVVSPPSSPMNQMPSNAAPPPPPNDHHPYVQHVHHYHHPVYSHDSNPMLNENPGHDSTTTSNTSTTSAMGLVGISNQLSRTDSPDNDSAFSDSISLISSEQSSSSSSGGSGNVGSGGGVGSRGSGVTGVGVGKCGGTSSGQSSQSVNSSGSSSSCEDNSHIVVVNQSNISNTKSSSIYSTTTTTSSIMNDVVNGHEDCSSINTIANQQQQIFLEQNDKKDDDSNKSDDDNDDDDDANDAKMQTLTRSNVDSFNRNTKSSNDNNNNNISNRISLTFNEKERFEMIDDIINQINDWRLSLASFVDNNNVNNNNNTIGSRKQQDILIMKIPNPNDRNKIRQPHQQQSQMPQVDYNRNSHDNTCGSGHNHALVNDVDDDHLRHHHNLDRQPPPPPPRSDSMIMTPPLPTIDGHKNINNKQDIEEKIRVAMEKIREANIRKLYLKIYAEDDSSKCLCADERMNVGTICQQMAHKNHISLGINYCIMENLPQLYLERFYEDHESLVENVLYWGRDHTNKLYFMQQPDKYDLFIQPEKYLISLSQPNENADTLKSGSLRAKYKADQLRADLISQFFTNSGKVIVPEIEGMLYLRSEGKKVWKKYFFSLRSSGLYYCLKGKPKSTKDLICLTTFEMNCVYYGLGWKKKFKAPNDFGFAIKHPHIQQKSPKHIKYLCAETQDDQRLWMTGIRIAKYGRQLLDNYEQLKINDLPIDEHDQINQPTTPNKKITTFPLNDSTNDLQNGNYATFGEENHYGHSNVHRSGSITMRANRVPRSDSVRSSSASSSSGCMSEQSSVVSTPSSGSGGTNNVHGVVDDSNYHMSLPHHPHMLPHSHQSPPQGPLNAFDADFPVGTIKRKPNVMIQPKIPLTNTTRNLALQSDDALLEVSDGSTGGSCVDEDSCCMNSMSSPSHHGSEQFQRGTFKTGTLRRSNVDSKAKMNMMSPQHQIYQTGPVKNSEMNHSDDDLPPPPPPPAILKEAESTLSLNTSFPPPPPPEVLDPPSPSSSSTSMSNISRQSDPQQQPHQQQQQIASSPSSPMKPPSMASLPLPPMTPQPQTKNRLARRLSDLSENSTFFSNFRSNYDGPYPMAPNGNMQLGMYGPNSRASIASSSDSSSFVTMKSNFLNNRRFQRNNSAIEYYQQQQQWNKYGTSPRPRPFEQAMNGNLMPTDHYYNNRQNHANYAAFVPPPPPPPPASLSSNPPNGSSHCAIVSDGPSPMPTQYDIPPTRVKVFSHHQISSSSALPQMMPPPPSNMDSHYGSYPNALVHQNRNQQPQSPRENHYMSISPHLLQKHQQMLQQQQQQQQQPQPNVPYHVPEELFLKNMERVMQKKWHVAQMLQQDNTATPGQVLGFRDSAYLPPPPPPPQGPSMMPTSASIEQQSNYHSTSHLTRYNSYNQYGTGTGNNMTNGSMIHSPSHYPSPVPVMESPYRTSPYHQRNQHQQQQLNGTINNANKTVQFSDNGPMILNGQEMMEPPPSPASQPMTPTHQSSNYHLNGSLGKKIPPPPPKRSESTQLTNCPSRR